MFDSSKPKRREQSRGGAEKILTSQIKGLILPVFCFISPAYSEFIV